MTALHLAASRNGLKTLTLLLEIPGIDVNIQNNAGFTALHCAASIGATEYCKLLIMKSRTNVAMLTTIRVKDILKEGSHDVKHLKRLKGAYFMVMDRGATAEELAEINGFQNCAMVISLLSVAFIPAPSRRLFLLSTGKFGVVNFHMLGQNTLPKSALAKALIDSLAAHSTTASLFGTTGWDTCESLVGIQSYCTKVKDRILQCELTYNVHDYRDLNHDVTHYPELLFDTHEDSSIQSLYAIVLPTDEVTLLDENEGDRDKMRYDLLQWLKTLVTLKVASCTSTTDGLASFTASSSMSHGSESYRSESIDEIKDMEGVTPSVKVSAKSPRAARVFQVQPPPQEPKVKPVRILVILQTSKPASASTARDYIAKVKDLMEDLDEFVSGWLHNKDDDDESVGSGAKESIGKPSPLHTASSSHHKQRLVDFDVSFLPLFCTSVAVSAPTPEDHQTVSSQNSSGSGGNGITKQPFDPVQCSKIWSKEQINHLRTFVKEFVRKTLTVNVNSASTKAANRTIQNNDVDLLANESCLFDMFKADAMLLSSRRTLIAEYFVEAFLHAHESIKKKDIHRLNLFLTKSEWKHWLLDNVEQFFHLPRFGKTLKLHKTLKELDESVKKDVFKALGKYCEDELLNNKACRNLLARFPSISSSMGSLSASVSLASSSTVGTASKRIHDRDRDKTSLAMITNITELRHAMLIDLYQYFTTKIMAANGSNSSVLEQGVCLIADEETLRDALFGKHIGSSAERAALVASGWFVPTKPSTTTTHNSKTMALFKENCQNTTIAVEELVRNQSWLDLVCSMGIGTELTSNDHGHRKCWMPFLMKDLPLLPKVCLRFLEQSITGRSRLKTGSYLARHSISRFYRVNLGRGSSDDSVVQTEKDGKDDELDFAHQFTVPAGYFLTLFNYFIGQCGYAIAPHEDVPRLVDAEGVPEIDSSVADAYRNAMRLKKTSTISISWSTSNSSSTVSSPTAATVTNTTPVQSASSSQPIKPVIVGMDTTITILQIGEGSFLVSVQSLAHGQLPQLNNAMKSDLLNTLLKASMSVFDLVRSRLHPCRSRIHRHAACHDAMILPLEEYCLVCDLPTLLTAMMQSECYTSSDGMFHPELLNQSMLEHCCVPLIDVESRIFLSPRGKESVEGTGNSERVGEQSYFGTITLSSVMALPADELSAIQTSLFQDIPIQLALYDTLQTQTFHGAVMDRNKAFFMSIDLPKCRSVQEVIQRCCVAMKHEHIRQMNLADDAVQDITYQACKVFANGSMSRVSSIDGNTTVTIKEFHGWINKYRGVRIVTSPNANQSRTPRTPSLLYAPILKRQSSAASVASESYQEIAASVQAAQAQLGSPLPSFYFLVSSDSSDAKMVQLAGALDVKDSGTSQTTKAALSRLASFKRMESFNSLPSSLLYSNIDGSRTHSSTTGSEGQLNPLRRKEGKKLSKTKSSFEDIELPDDDDDEGGDLVEVDRLSVYSEEAVRRCSTLSCHALIFGETEENESPLNCVIT